MPNTPTSCCIIRPGLENYSLDVAFLSMAPNYSAPNCYQAQSLWSSPCDICSLFAPNSSPASCRQPDPPRCNWVNLVFSQRAINLQLHSYLGFLCQSRGQKKKIFAEDEDYVKSGFRLEWKCRIAAAREWHSMQYSPLIRNIRNTERHMESSFKQPSNEKETT